MHNLGGLIALGVWALASGCSSSSPAGDESGCSGDKPFAVKGDPSGETPSGCAECLEDSDCPTDRRCSTTSNYSVYGQLPRCVPRDGCDADDQCPLLETCVDNACTTAGFPCDSYNDCHPTEDCSNNVCTSLNCPAETPFVGTSEGGRFCEECRNDDDCPGDEICQDWDRASVYPVAGHCRPPGCTGDDDCHLGETCVDAECVTAN